VIFIEMLVSSADCITMKFMSFV